jgi:hypothetical protein
MSSGRVAEHACQVLAPVAPPFDGGFLFHRLRKIRCIAQARRFAWFGEPPPCTGRRVTRPASQAAAYAEISLRATAASRSSRPMSCKRLIRYSTEVPPIAAKQIRCCVRMADVSPMFPERATVGSPASWCSKFGARDFCGLRLTWSAREGRRAAPGPHPFPRGACPPAKSMA